MRIYVCAKTSLQIFIAPLFTVAQTGKTAQIAINRTVEDQSVVPLYTGVLLVIKRSKLLIHTTWMNFMNVLGTGSQASPHPTEKERENMLYDSIYINAL